MLEIITSLGTLVTLLLMLWQASQITKQTKASVYQNISNQMQNIDAIFIKFPQLRPYFYENKDVELEQFGNELERHRIEAMSELILDFIDNTYVQRKYLPEYPWETWDNYFRDLIRMSPILRRRIREAVEEGWYPDSFAKNLLAGVSQKSKS